MDCKFQMESNTYEHSKASQTFFKKRAVHKVNTLSSKLRNYGSLRNKEILIKISELDVILIDYLNYLVPQGIIPKTWTFIIEV